MTPKKVIGNVLAVMGHLGLIYAIWGLIDIGSCGGEGASPCPPEATPYFIAMFLGIPAIVIGGIMAQTSLLLMALDVPAFGVMFLTKALLDREPDERLPLLILAGVLLLATVGIGVLAARSLAKRRLIARLVATGSRARGRVAAVRDTGVRINNNPRVELAVDIEPIDGSPGWRDMKTITMSDVSPVHVGDALPVWYDAADRSTWALGSPDGKEVPDHIWREFGIEPPSARATNDGRLSALERLGRLREQGVLTAEEFDSEKARVLGSDDDDGFGSGF